MTLTQKQKRYIAATIVRKTRSLGNCQAFVYYFDGRFDGRYMVSAPTTND